MRKWRLRVQLAVPSRFESPPGGGPPSQLIPLARFDDQCRQYGDMTIAIRGDLAPRHFAGLKDGDIGWRVSELAVDLESRDGPLDVLSSTGPLIERIADLLSFQFAAPVLWGQGDMVDITPPVAEGETRDFLIFPTPPFDLNIRAFPGAGARGNDKGVLPEITDLDDRVAAALRWYTKALRTDFLHDQFIALWIAVELFCDRSAVSVTEPYRGNCGHVIENCPQCGRSTSRQVRGATIQRFLSEELGLDAGVSHRLWRVRQMLHGDVTFDPSQLSDLPTLVVALRAAVTGALDNELKPLGHPVTAPDEGALTGHPGMVASGYRELVLGDISPL